MDGTHPTEAIVSERRVSRHANQPVQPTLVKQSVALTLGLHIPVSTLLDLLRWLPQAVPRVGHAQAEPRGNSKVFIRHEVGLLRRREEESPTAPASGSEVNPVLLRQQR